MPYAFPELLSPMRAVKGPNSGTAPMLFTVYTELLYTVCYILLYTVYTELQFRQCYNERGQTYLSSVSTGGRERVIINRPGVLFSGLNALQDETAQMLVYV